MDLKNSLLIEIKNSLNIVRGERESIDAWRRRIIYSAIGKISYAALWEQEGDQPISKIKFGNTIEKLYDVYKELFPNSFFYAEDDHKEWQSEIQKIYYSNGLVYNLPERISPCRYNNATIGNILFIRGEEPGMEYYKSGLGSYKLIEDVDPISNNVFEMFQIPRVSLQEQYNNLRLALKSGNWKYHKTDDSVKFLNIFQEVLPFRNGYWKLQPDKEVELSMMRIGEKGARQYYFYYFQDGMRYSQQLPEWKVLNGQNRNISNCILEHHNQLPPITYELDGAITNITLNYLPPPRELDFIKLYSWPGEGRILPSNFNRVMTTDVFYSIKSIFEKKGYRFIEVKNDD